MTSQQVKDLLDHIQKNNSWEAMNNSQDEITENKRVVKYVRLNIDTRDGIMFNASVKFDNIIRGGKDREMTFSTESEEDIKSLYDWLDEKVVD